MDSGVKVVGAAPTEEAEPDTPAGGSGTRQTPGHSARPPRPTWLIAIALLGLIGTAVFGVLWGTSGGGSNSQDGAVLSTTARVSSISSSLSG